MRSARCCIGDRDLDVRSLVSSLAIATILGCTPAVDVDRLAEPPSETTDPSCTVRFYRDTGPTDRCLRVARARVRDTGFTTSCDTARVREEVRKVACDAGGDAAVLHRVTNAISTCIQTDAEIYRCADRPDAETGDPTLAPQSHSSDSIAPK